MESKDFAVFILSHGRADTISTYRALRDGGYTGRTYVVIDNEDDQEERNVSEIVLQCHVLPVMC